MFCTNCGKKLPDHAKFCDSCGCPVESEAVRPSQDFGNGQLIGFSQRYQDPEILHAIEKEKKSNMGCLWSFTAAPFVIFFLMSLVEYITSDVPMNGGLFVGALLSGILVVIAAIVTLVKKILPDKPMWDGVVVDKKKASRPDHKKNKREPDRAHFYTEYTLVIRKENGKKQKLTNRDNSEQYYHFQVGDRVRWHPNLSYLEKYDKSRDNYIFCAVCGKKNHIKNDRCEHCNAPLFK